MKASKTGRGFNVIVAEKYQYDPDEFTNLAQADEHAQTLEELMHELRARRSKFGGKIPSIRK